MVPQEPSLDTLPIHLWGLAPQAIEDHPGDTAPPRPCPPSCWVLDIAGSCLACLLSPQLDQGGNRVGLLTGAGDVCRPQADVHSGSRPGSRILQQRACEHVCAQSLGFGLSATE